MQQNLSAVILENQGKGTMRGILVDSVYHTQELEMGEYLIKAELSAGGEPRIAGGLIIQTGSQEYIVAGKGLDVFFISKDTSMQIGIDAVDEGKFKEGKWVPERRLNGDETHASTWDGTGVRLTEGKVKIQKVSLYKYK